MKADGGDWDSSAALSSFEGVERDECLVRRVLADVEFSVDGVAWSFYS